MVNVITKLADFELTVSRLSGGMTNKTYLLTSRKDNWVLRVGGVGTSNFIDRETEINNAKIASEHDINVKLEWVRHIDGLQLTRFVPSTPFSLITADNSIYKFCLVKIANLLKKLHTIEKPFENDVNIFEVNKNYLKKIKEEKPSILPCNFKLLTRFLKQTESLFVKFDYNFVPCHNDTTPSNFLIVDENSVFAIDWEYSGNNDKLWDLVYFGIESNLNNDDFKNFLESYFEDVTPEINTWVAVYRPLVCACISLWAYYQIANGATSCTISEYHELANKYFDKTVNYLNNDFTKKSLEILNKMLEGFYQGKNNSNNTRRFPRGF